MKSYGGIMQKATSYGALSDAIDIVFRGTKRKQTRFGRWVLNHRDEFILQCRQRMYSGNFKIQGYREYTVIERGKERKIQCIKMEDRVPLNALMKEVLCCLKREFIYTTASSIEGRGAIWLYKQILKMRKKHPEVKWFYKCDIKKFYESISQEKLIRIVCKKFRESYVRQIMCECIKMLPSGLSIGLRASQENANLYLSVFIDHLIKDKVGCKWYYRYCDDIVVGAAESRDLTNIIHHIHTGANNAGLLIKRTEQVFRINDRPIDFLGFKVFWNGKIAIRKHIKLRFARRWNRVKSFKRKRELLGSFYGMSKHANCLHLFKVITSYNMKDFAALGISYVAEDGKKRYNCPIVQLNELQNRTIVVKDFELSVSTKNGERTLVWFEDENGHEGKFFTASEELKQLLNKIREIDEIPFRTTIVRKRMAENKYKYCFT